MAQHVLVYSMVPWDKVFVDAFHKGIQYTLEKLGWWLEPIVYSSSNDFLCLKV